jgi:hypothetical protein
LSDSIDLPALVTGTGEVLDATVKGDWGVYLCQRSGDDYMHVYSYYGPGNDFTSLTAYNTENHTLYDTTNVCGVFTRNNLGPYEMRLYSPGTDTWMVENFFDIQPLIRLQRDYIIYWDFNLFSASVVMFDGVTGDRTQFEFGWGTSTDFTNNTYHKSNFLLVYTTTGRHIGYSTYTRTWSEMSGPRAMSRYGINDIAVLIPESATPGMETFTYNALYDSWVEHRLTAEQGTIQGGPQVGISTALMKTTGGFLLAFDPHKSTPTAIDDDPSTDDLLPETMQVSQNYPNPFNPATRIEFSLPERSDVRVEVFNTLGQRVRVLLDESRPAGDHTVYWDGRDVSGASVASGVYFYRVTAGDYVSSKKMMLVK